MKIKKLLEILDGKLLSEEKHLEYEVEHGLASDLISDLLLCAKYPAALFTGLVNHQIIRVAEMIELQAIIFVRGKEPSEELLRIAAKNDMPILITKMSLFKTCALAYQGGLEPSPIKVSFNE